jgi:UDP-N-acetylmuramoyl-tripeptide--D-alanyl-D-alanine ligase
MQDLTIGEIVAATGGILLFGDKYVNVSGVSTDTRSLHMGDLFVALSGERFDGHGFLADAVRKGAAALMVSCDLSEDPGIPVVCVRDTLEALGDLAMYYRSRFSGKIIAVTGSTGKTSTKDMIAALLGQKYCVLKTFENFNNEVGLPLTIFGLRACHDFAVVEMGMRGLGQISRLSDIAKPHVGVITNVNETHIELLGTKQMIAEAKQELIQSLPSTGMAVLNRDNLHTWCMRNVAKCPVRSFGLDYAADVRAEDVCAVSDKGTEFRLVTPEFSGKVFLSVPGLHNVMNALSAVCAVLDYGIELTDVNSAFSNFSLTEGRTSILSLPCGITVIDDTYNASPVSTKAALQLLYDTGRTGRKVAVLGDMLELGEYEIVGHLDVGRTCVNAGVDILVTVGSISRYIREGAMQEGLNQTKIVQFENSAQAANAIRAIVKPEDTVLVKGSRGMKMEKVVDALQKEISK